MTRHNLDPFPGPGLLCKPARLPCPNSTEEVESGLATIPGLRPVRIYEEAWRGGFYGFPVIDEPARMNVVTTTRLIDALNHAGLGDGRSPYPNLHTLPLFANGSDVFTRDRGPLSPAQSLAPPKSSSPPSAAPSVHCSLPPDPPDFPPPDVGRRAAHSQRAEFALARTLAVAQPTSARRKPDSQS